MLSAGFFVMPIYGQICIFFVVKTAFSENQLPVFRIAYHIINITL